MGIGAPAGGRAGRDQPAAAGSYGRGFYQLSVEGVADGLVTVSLALAIGGALAAGVTLGQFVTRPIATPLGPAEPAPRHDRQ
jgi:hypothetical protein